MHEAGGPAAVTNSSLVMTIGGSNIAEHLPDYWQRFLKSVSGWRIPLMSDSTCGLAFR